MLALQLDLISKVVFARKGFSQLKCRRINFSISNTTVITESACRLMAILMMSPKVKKEAIKKQGSGRAFGNQYCFTCVCVPKLFARSIRAGR